VKEFARAHKLPAQKFAHGHFFHEYDRRQVRGCRLFAASAREAVGTGQEGMQRVDFVEVVLDDRRKQLAPLTQRRVIRAPLFCRVPAGNAGKICGAG